MPAIAISKTKLLSYLQCPRKLWLEQYSPELEDEDAFDYAAIETGRVVGEMARRVYGPGHLVKQNRGLRSAVAETEALLAAGGSEPIFEATFDYDGVTVQVDVLDRREGLRIVEVKSSTSVKEQFAEDCAIQAWAMQALELPPTGIGLALIDSDFEYRGDDDYSGLFKEVDLTAELEPLIAAMPETVAAARATLDSLDEPEREIGPHCTKPHRCQFFEHCAPAQGDYPVLGLGGSKERLYAWMREGYKDLRDVPEAELTNEQQQRIQQQTASGKPYLDDELKRAVTELPYPRYFVDFETIGFAIPIWPGTRPYEALPFQWSCHVDSGE
ncbi:MAG: DUF2779 domain-containing protein, partial [Gammaproteobacteria bacterium]|nr:DUF2779 domain-containing protein [Gammaproteobacteria bacterium]